MHANVSVAKIKISRMLSHTLGERGGGSDQTFINCILGNKTHFDAYEKHVLMYFLRDGISNTKRAS